MEFPTIDLPDTTVVRAELPSGAFALASVRTGALSELSQVERGLAELKAEHGSTAYDISTTTGYKLATLRRHAIRLVRYKVPKVVKARKAELKGVIDDLEKEGERITEALLALERPHDLLITAEDERREAERAAKAAVEAERVRKLEERLAAMSKWVDRCREPGMTADRIDNGITAFMAIEIGDDWQEFKDRAQARADEVLGLMTQIHAEKLRAEEDFRALEAQRIENERVAAEQRAEAERLAAERRRLEAEAAALAAARAESERLERIAQETRARATLDPAEETPPSPVVDELQPQTDAEIKAANGPEVELPSALKADEATDLLAIGQLNARLGLGNILTRTVLAGFGFNPITGANKNAVLYPASDWPRICDALITHITAKKGN